MACCLCCSIGRMWHLWPKTSLTRPWWWTPTNAWQHPRPSTTRGWPRGPPRLHRRTSTAPSPTTCCSASPHAATAQSLQNLPRATSPTGQGTRYGRTDDVSNRRRLMNCTKTRRSRQSWRPWAACTVTTACTMYSQPGSSSSVQGHSHCNVHCTSSHSGAVRGVTAALCRHAPTVEQGAESQTRVPLLWSDALGLCGVHWMCSCCGEVCSLCQVCCVQRWASSRHSHCNVYNVQPGTITVIATCIVYSQVQSQSLQRV